MKIDCAQIAALLLAFAANAALAQDARRSGFDFMSPETQAMQRDDTANPGMLFVRQGEALWNKSEGAEGKSCASCHGDARQSMRGVAARFPAWSEAANKPLGLQEQVNHCRAGRQKAAALPAENQALLALSTYVAHQSRGLAIAPPKDKQMEAAAARGEALYRQRIGQLNLSCAQCHDGNAGKRLAGNPIPEAHPSGYPLYRLEWQNIGSLQRRVRNCMTGVRAEPFAYFSDEMIALEAFLMQRASGMPLETPGVRP